MNKAILMGRLVADPDKRQTESGHSVATFRIAVDRPSKDKITDFISIVVWRNTADFVCQYFGKGDMIAVEGSIQVRGYTDKEGKNRSVTEVVADRVHFCGSRQNANNGAKQGEESLDFEEIEVPSAVLTF